MSNSIVTRIVEQLEDLPDDQQRQVLDYVQTLNASLNAGKPAVRLLSYAGRIPLDDLKAMEEAIKGGLTDGSSLNH